MKYQWENQEQDGSSSRRMEETSRRRIEAPSKGGQCPEGALASLYTGTISTNVEIVPNSVITSWVINIVRKSTQHLKIFKIVVF